MSSLTKQIFLFLTFITLFSCNEIKRENNPTINDQVPIALQDHKSYELESISKRASNNLVEELYNEILKNDKDLQLLIKSIEDNYKSQNKSKELFNAFFDKNTQYYSNANSMIMNINDTLLKNKVERLIFNSENNYKALSKESYNLLSTIDKNNISLNEYQQILKITTTISMIEKYQKDQLPSYKSLNTIIKEQSNQIKKLKQLSNIQ
jgi:predicted ATPase with chaperone activity